MRNPKAKVSDPNKFTTCAGSDVHVTYNSKVLPNGEIRLSPSGKESISEKINAYKQYTDITFIANRLAMGDTSVLRDGAMYGDFTQTPKSLAESLQIIIEGQKKFDMLPLDVKNKFNNNYYQWIMQSGSMDWYSKMGVDIPKIIEEVKQEEVKTDES